LIIFPGKEFDYLPRKGIALFYKEKNCVIFLGKEFDYFPRKGI
jgi:hypothetical protein